MAYSQVQKDKIFNNICALIESGISSRSAIVKEGIGLETFYRWVEQDSVKSKQYARSCIYRAEKMADEILNICDATADDIIKDSEGNEIVNHNVIQRDRLRVDTRKWLLAKLHPKKYGDKVDVTTDGDKINNVSMLNLPDFMKKD